MTILDELYAHWNERDIDGVLSCFTDDFTLTDKAMGLTLRGAQELRQFMAASFDSLPDVRYELLHSFETDAGFAGQALMTGTFAKDLGGVKATGKPFSVDYGIVGRKVDGRISEYNDYWNVPQFLGE